MKMGRKISFAPGGQKKKFKTDAPELVKTAVGGAIALTVLRKGLE